MLLSRVGWGYFDVEVEIEFQKSTGLGLKKVVHELCFEGKGKTQSFDLEIEDDKEALSEIKKLMDELSISEKKVKK